MITLSKVHKLYPTRKGMREILHDINLTIEKGQKIGIMGCNGSGKSTLVRLIAGAEAPSRGYVKRAMTVSWPLAFSGGFQVNLTGLDNLRFICRIYGADFQKALPFVEAFSELGDYLREPVKKYSSGMFARLGFAVSMAIEFDCYLIDEVLAVGDQRFSEKCRLELFEKRRDRAMVIVSHAPEQLRSHCDTFFVLNKGHILKLEDFDQAYEYYTTQQRKKHETTT